MSRGLGKIERYALAHLWEAAEESRTLDRPGAIDSIDSIARRRAHDEWLAREGRTCDHSHACCDDPSYRPTPAEYEAMRRAVRSLERKGYVDRYRPRLRIELTTYGEQAAADLTPAR